MFFPGVIREPKVGGVKRLGWGVSVLNGTFGCTNVTVIWALVPCLSALCQNCICLLWIHKCLKDVSIYGNFEGKYLRRRVLTFLLLPIVVFVFMIGWVFYWMGKQQNRSSVKTFESRPGVEDAKSSEEELVEVGLIEEIMEKEVES
jgi:hypothetical protein